MSAHSNQDIARKSTMNANAADDESLTLIDPAVQRAVLGAAVMDGSLLRGPLVDLSVSDFVGTQDQAVYRALLQLEEDGEPFDGITLARLAKEKGGAIENGGPAYFGELIDGAVSDSAVVKHHAETLQKLSQLRRLALLGETIGRKTRQSVAEPALLLHEVELAVQALRNGYDLDDNLLPYAPDDVRQRPEILTLANVEARDVDWLWQPYLPMAMLAMLSGDPGSGKTYLALAIAAALTVGRQPFTGEPLLANDVLYLSQENSPEHVLRPRFDLLRGDPSRFHILRGSLTGSAKRVKRKAFKLSDISLLHDALAKIGARLVIVDPIQSYLGAEVDAHRSNETRPVLDGLARLAEEHQACILLIRHFAKSSMGRAIHRGLGSVDLTGAVRTELHAGSVDDRRVVVHAKSNLGQLGKSLEYAIDSDGTFHWNGETEITASDLQAAEQTRDDRSAVEDAAECLREALDVGRRPCIEVQAELRAAGMSDATIRRAKRKLGLLSHKTEMRGGWEWVLPEGAHS